MLNDTQSLGPSGPQPTTIDLSRGNHFFVRFPESHGSTVYLYDKNRKVLVPFTSDASFEAFSGKPMEQAENMGEIYDFPPEVQVQLGSVVPDQYGFGDDGTISNMSYYEDLPDINTLNNLHGKPKNLEMEKKAADMIGRLFTMLKKG